jgi:hypothetical protein
MLTQGNRVVIASRVAIGAWALTIGCDINAVMAMASGMIALGFTLMKGCLEAIGRRE